MIANRVFLLIVIFSSVVTLLIAGDAAAARKPKIQTGPDAEVSYDGLHRVDRTVVDEAWVKPDIDLTRYNKIMVVSGGVSYRDVKEPPPRSYRSRTGNFPLSEKQKKRFEKIVLESFVEELRKVERFEMVRRPGPDTMVIVGFVLDVVSRIPPEPMGRGGIFLTEVGSATLALQIHDSQSNEILARIIDRRTAESTRMIDAHSANSWAEARRVTRSWAKLLRKRLDQVGEFTGD